MNEVKFKANISDLEALQTSYDNFYNRAVTQVTADLTDAVQITGSYISPGPNEWTATGPKRTAYLLDISDHKLLKLVVKSNNSYPAQATILSGNDATIGNTPTYATGYTEVTQIPIGETQEFILPADALYLYYLDMDGSLHSHLPDSVIVDTLVS